MDIKSILTMSPFFSPMVGPIFGADNYDYIRYRINVSNDAEEDNIYFVKVGNDIKVVNRLKKTILLSFPHENNVAGKMYRINPNSNKVMTESLLEHATACGNRPFEISVLDFMEADSNTIAESSEVVLSAAGQIDKDIAGEVKLADELAIEVINDALLVIVKPPYTLKEILLLTISGTNNEAVRRYQCVEITEEGPGSRFCIPDAVSQYKLSENINVSINVSCSCDTAQFGMMHPVNEPDDFYFLREGRCLNDDGL